MTSTSDNNSKNSGSFITYASQFVAAIATATTLTALTTLYSGSQEIARMQEQIKGVKEQLVSIQTLFQGQKSDNYLQNETLNRWQSKIEARIDELRKRD
ncbi:MAG: hypothetical protein WBB28_18005 [Crinalium sp.]